ncbi:methylenetetrahydrofolate dehydrogenase (NADP+) / methenyltetrahydrofolate cyclohydrolase [Paenibacillus sp. UNCCL117]|uniref:bifunctional methylenetetrahydrofolate dehydrogenase/methenyltetrahydrofolate cyclohydrolase FolD n=1 Tax=unclassified Paenibacillus TaxID=185978 RepID=UPI0008921B97|nr:MULTISPECIES: bifunctional methylenetetrahydrofolate dehydrogenase/methenyltetrahydrofolate cyclohydrolase FolD [unclassified Paenibacillus]SDD44403.1 methenyltetrahydrofolate cyclohydrolase [Paenibacillus sp. cl123]SFW47139.1 methylenetetrahydrofolate dehydrogenase (NADP+) / methenyltetrahydrofolate cyclohydrolase [Paenibacillus sp. UNCCL117]
MSAHVINGKELVGAYRAEIKQQVERLAGQGVKPGLAVVIVGDDPASHVYVRNKNRACEEAGIHSEVYKLAAETTEEELLALIAKLNADEAIHGILVQSPLPGHINEERVVEAIAVEKDVDCFHPVNVGNLMIGKPGPAPCTPAGVIEILKKTGVEIAGKHAVVIGRSNIVGKPMAVLLLRENATVTVCHSRTKDLAAVTSQADILVAAIGKPKVIKREHVKPGAVVIDVGVNRLDTGKLSGDVDFDDVVDAASVITPVPGVVGPMTITILLRNTLEAAERAAGLRASS